MTEPVRFTAAICTRNHGGLLPTAVRSVARQDYAPERFDVLVVDNGSTDDTPQVVEQLAHEYACVRGVIEKQPGLGQARNRAMTDARGEFIVYIDDDAEMAPGYLAALDRLLREEEHVGAAGGPIEVAWLGPVPSWYEPALDGLFNKLSHYCPNVSRIDSIG